MKLSVRFVRAYHDTAGGGLRGYNIGEVAGFPDSEAEALVAAGIAERVSLAAHPLVAEALRITDPRVLKAAQALQSLPSHISALRAKIDSHAGTVASLEKAEARSLVSGGRIDKDAAARREELAELSRQFALFESSDRALFQELADALVAYAIDEHRRILSDELTPRARSLVALVKEAHAVHAQLRATRTQLEPLRQLRQKIARIREEDTEVFEPEHAAEVAVGEEITGQTPSPHRQFAVNPYLGGESFLELISAIASKHEEASGEV